MSLLAPPSQSPAPLVHNDWPQHAVESDLQRLYPTAMRQTLRDGAPSAASFQSIFGWDDVKLNDSIQRATEAISRADIEPTEIWRALRSMIGTTRLLSISLKQLNAEADLVSRSFATDGLFRLPHEKNGSPPPGWFEPTMVYSWRDPGVLYDFPTLTLEFLRFARVEAERRSAREAGTTVEAQREEWRLKEAAESRDELTMKARERRRNTSSAESSPVRSRSRSRRRGGTPGVALSPITLRDGKRVPHIPSVVLSRPAPLGSSNAEEPSILAATPLRSRFTHEFEIEADGV
jgi:hypothetical protein